MIKPISNLEHLLEVNPDYKIVSADNGFIVIDDWYKNFDELQDFLYNSNPSMWTPKTDDWFDGKLFLAHHHTAEKIELLIKEHFNINVVLSYPRFIDFNYFTLYKKQNKGNVYQHPHFDKHPLSAVIYMDKICDGGTAWYNIDYKKWEHDIFIVDLETYENKVKYIPTTEINSKPNRMVIGYGGELHSGYFNDINSYLNEWRITQVIFMEYENRRQ